MQLNVMMLCHLLFHVFLVQLFQPFDVHKPLSPAPPIDGADSPLQDIVSIKKIT